MKIGIYPGCVIYVNGLEGQKGSVSCFCYKQGSKGIFAITSAHVVCEGGDPTKPIVPKIEVIAPLPQSPSTDPAARIKGKNADADIALLGVIEPKLLELGNFCLGGAKENGEIVGMAKVTVECPGYIWGGQTTERSQSSPKPIIKGTVSAKGNRINLKGDPTNKGDSGSPIYVIENGKSLIVGVYGNAGSETAKPYSNFGEEIGTALQVAGKLLGGTASLATWDNKSEWL